MQEFSDKLRKYLVGTSEGISGETSEKNIGGTPEGIPKGFSNSFPGKKLMKKYWRNS